MAKTTNRNPILYPWHIDEISVGGFKSIADEQKIAVRPLTILAGANSSGKSSMLQPLLLLKQTLEATYDPGALLLHGPNVRFTSSEQLLARLGNGRASDSFDLGIRLNTGEFYSIRYRKEHARGFRIEQMRVSEPPIDLTIWPEMGEDEIVESGVTKGNESLKLVPHGYGSGHWKITRDRCFLELTWAASLPNVNGSGFTGSRNLGAILHGLIPDIIHLPGLRGTPERAYPSTAVSDKFVGTFEKYTASVIAHWQAEKQTSILLELGQKLKLLALTGGVFADRTNDVQIELYVGRTPTLSPKHSEDRVNIADVGFGVSQALPVVVALLAARPGQLVYLEQPEIHLHPRAQVAMAQVLADAANRGVRVVAETHSSLLLLGIQALVAEGKLSADVVKLHWFTRNKEGATTIASADIDEAGAFGEWPEDFGDVELTSQSRYLDAAEVRRMKMRKPA